MNYDQLEYKCTTENFKSFSSVVNVITIEELDSIVTSLDGTDKIKQLINSIEDNGTIEELRYVYYRIFAKVNRATLGRKTDNILPIMIKAYSFFKKENEKEGIVLLGVYLVDVIMARRTDVAAAVKILTEVLTAAKDIEGNKDELYVTSCLKSNIFYYTEEIGDRLNIFINDFYETGLLNAIDLPKSRVFADVIAQCCKTLYNLYNKDQNKAHYYMDRVEYFLTYSAQDGEAH